MIGPPPGGSQVPTRDPIVAPGASSTVDRDTIPGRTSNNRKSTMEMPALWKPQNGFHSALEISHTTRDSHIPTADHFSVSQEEDEEEDVRHALRTTARQTVTG